jgi:hypothetical protein
MRSCRVTIMLLIIPSISVGACSIRQIPKASAFRIAQQFATDPNPRILTEPRNTAEPFKIRDRILAPLPGRGWSPFHPTTGPPAVLYCAI